MDIKWLVGGLVMTLAAVIILPIALDQIEATNFTKYGTYGTGLKTLWKVVVLIGGVVSTGFVFYKGATN